MEPVTRQQHKIIEAAAAIMLDRPTDEDKAFMARQLVQATLPHSNPGNVGEWSRTNGNMTLAIRSGWKKDPETGERKPIGYPYGTIPRLLMFWVSTEAIRTKSRRLELGRSFSDFMKQLGLNPDNGGTGAKRSDARRLRDQMERLFMATISFDCSTNNATAWMNMNVAPKGMLWWDDKDPNQRSLFESWIELGEDFFKAITESPVPVDMRALKALKKSPLALDLYAWATYTAYTANKSGNARSVSWDLLHKQFGGDYKRLDNFQQKAMAAVTKIKTVYPSLQFEKVEGGICILPDSLPAVAVKAAVDKATRAERILPPLAPKRGKKAEAVNPAPMIPALEEALGGVNYTIPAAVLERAEGMAREAGTNWSVFHLEREFYVFARHKGEILRNPEGAFLRFVQKKIQKQA